MSSTFPKQPTQNNPRKRRKGKGARARERWQKAQALKNAQEKAQKEKEQELEERKKSLGLKRGDVVVTVPSCRYPVSTELTVYNITYNPTRDDFMITFQENGSNGESGSSHAWGENLGRSFHKKLPEEK